MTGIWAIKLTLKGMSRCYVFRNRAIGLIYYGMTDTRLHNLEENTREGERRREKGSERKERETRRIWTLKNPDRKRQKYYL